MILDMTGTNIHVALESELALIEFLNNTKLSARPEVSTHESGVLNMTIKLDENFRIRAVLHSVENVDISEYVGGNWIPNKNFTNVHGLIIRYDQLRYKSLHAEYQQEIESRL